MHTQNEKNKTKKKKTRAKIHLVFQEAGVTGTWCKSKSETHRAGLGGLDLCKFILGLWILLSELGIPLNFYKQRRNKKSSKMITLVIVLNKGQD